MDAWKVSREIAVMLLRMGREDWQPWAAALFSQASRASLSVQLNIAEGYAFGRSPTRLRHYRIAYGSAVETGELCDHLVEAQIVAREGAEHYWHCHIAVANCAGA